MERTIWLKVLGLAAMFVLIVAGSTQAAPLVSESFNYTVGGNLAGNGTGTGWTGNWGLGTVSPPGGGSTYSATIVSGLTFTGDPTSGGAVQVACTSFTSPATVNIYRELNVTTGSTLWFSMLYKCTAHDASPSDAFQGFGTLTSASPPPNNNPSTTPSLKLITNNTGTGLIKVQLDSLAGGNMPTATGTSYANLDGNVYMIVAEFTSVSPINAGRYNYGKMWLLSNANYTNIVNAGGFTEANLDAYNTQRNQCGPADSGAETPVLVPGGFLQFRTRANTTVILDEIRWGSTGLDVLPEPATMALLAIGGLGMLVRRRRR